MIRASSALTHLLGVCFSITFGSFSVAAATNETVQNELPALDSTHDTSNIELVALHKLVMESNYFDLDTFVKQEAFNHSIQYEGYYTWSSPQSEWSNWDILFRPWIIGRSSNDIANNLSSNGSRFDGEYIEAREFYFRKNNMFDEPDIYLIIGRQQFVSDYGFWWDDSFASAKLAWNRTWSGGFVALGSKTESYAYSFADGYNILADSQDDIAYLFGEYWVQPRADLVTGIRFLNQQDYSGFDDLNDISDFSGTKLGVFIKDRQLNPASIFDFYADFSMTKGEHKNIAISGYSDTQSAQGWALFSEIGYTPSYQGLGDRMAFRLGITDRAKSQLDTFYVAPIQSDRANVNPHYSTGISGSFLGNQFTNIRFAGFTYEKKLSERNYLQFMAFDLSQRNDELPLSVSIREDYKPGKGGHIGKTFELLYYWDMFPTKIRDKLLNLNLLASAGYFLGGNALAEDVEDYKFSLGISVSY